MKPGAGSAGSKTFRETRHSGKLTVPGNRYVPENEGVGEHVRIRFQPGL
jgi:hypothetical protein